MTEENVRPAGDQDAVRLYGEEFNERPLELYQRLRREYGPVVPVLLEGDFPAWFVIGYRELKHVASNPDLFARDTRRWNAWDTVPEDWPLMPYVAWSPAMWMTEGAEHQRRAGAVSDALDAIDRTELAILSEEVTDGLIDGFAGDGEADLLDRYADPIPPLVFARLLGLPEAEVPALIKDIADSAGSDENAIPAFQRLNERLRTLVEHKKVYKGPDISSRMLAHPAGLTVDEVVHDIVLLLAAAHLPTSNWIGNTLRLMLVDERFAMTLQGGRGSVAQALNQVLWEDTPQQNVIGRFAAHACELGGHTIRAGEMVVMGYSAANADPQVRPISPGHGADNRAHLSFGHGEHGCPFPVPELAEIIAKTSVEVLLDRLPDVELSVKPDELEWVPSLWIRRLAALPVAFTPAGSRRGA
ncbi:cytochrome P450 [Actinomadura vinacea]|uniref:Cytochrome P450 n=1 Tax=Actinomadura vinacea TaxID=115336 RepID=A0ABN3JHA6_9ACTN